MNQNCKRCGCEIVEVSLSEEQTLEVWGLIQQDMKLFAVKKMKDDFGLSHGDSKIIVSHLNKEFGHCIRCNYDELEDEKVECPKCKAFNYNLKVEYSFNKDFCSTLEYRLDPIDIGSENLKGFWCDGISHLPADIKSLAKARLRKDKTIRTTAWIGKDGQDTYNMELFFGPDSLEKYERNESLVDCIPNGPQSSWISFEPNEKIVRIRLN